MTLIWVLHCLAQPLLPIKNWAESGTLKIQVNAAFSTTRCITLCIDNRATVIYCTNFLMTLTSMPGEVESHFPHRHAERMFIGDSGSITPPPLHSLHDTPEAREPSSVGSVQRRHSHPKCLKM